MRIYFITFYVERLISYSNGAMKEDLRDPNLLKKKKNSIRDPLLQLFEGIRQIAECNRELEVLYLDFRFGSFTCYVDLCFIYYKIIILFLITIQMFRQTI